MSYPDRTQGGRRLVGIHWASEERVNKMWPHWEGGWWSGTSGLRQLSVFPCSLFRRAGRFLRAFIKVLNLRSKYQART